MFHKVSSIEPCPNQCLLVGFADGAKKMYDVKRLFDKWPVFRVLETDDRLFQAVKVDQGGYGVSWNDELDLSCNELYYQGN